MTFFLVLAAALLAVQEGSAPLAPAEAAPAARVSIPFDPPLGRRLVFRGQRIEQGPAGEMQPRRFAFALEFEAAGDSYIMTRWPARADGSPAETSAAAPALRRLRFRLAPDGEIVGMVDEPAYWAAIEALLEADVRARPDDREAEGALWAMRQTRDLPLPERMHSLAADAAPLLFFAGQTVESDRGAEESGVQDSVVGPVRTTTRTEMEHEGPDAITITQLRTISADDMQRAVDQLTGRYGRLPHGLGHRIVSSETRQTFTIDRRSGLARSYRSIQTLVSEDEGGRRTGTATVTLELVD
jgi:hypothetical protein